MEKNNFILCLETTTEVCSVALALNGKCISEKNVREPNAHGSILTVLIEDILKENKLMMNDLSAAAYSSGPGSYTGLRIGLSVAKGICYGTDIPLIDISTLKHMTFNQVENQGKDILYFPMVDARRMEVYGALLDADLNFKKEPFACIVDTFNWEELLSGQKICFLGNGVAKSKNILTRFPNAILVEDYLISAASICQMAEERFHKREFADLAYHTPFYLKEANVTEEKKKPH